MDVLIVDDHPLVREALARALAQLGYDMRVFQAGSVAGALSELQAHPAMGFILLDLMLPDAQGTTALERLRQARPDVPAAILSAEDGRLTVLAAFAHGARGFISKRSSYAVLVNALRLVLAGHTYIPPEILHAEAVPPALASAAGRALEPRCADGDPGLTPRQMEVLALLAQGKPNKVISRELRLAEGTVKTHAAAIFRRLRVANRTQAVFAMNRLGIKLALPAQRPASEAVVGRGETAGSRVASAPGQAAY